jgi:hypothetical protein
MANTIKDMAAVRKAKAKEAKAAAPKNTAAEARFIADFAARMGGVMHADKISKAQLAAGLGCSVAKAYKLCAEPWRMTVRDLCAIAKVLKMKVELVTA